MPSTMPMPGCPKLSTATAKALPHPGGGRGGQDEGVEDEGRAGEKEERGAGGENVTKGNQQTDSEVARGAFGRTGREASAFSAAQEKMKFSMRRKNGGQRSRAP